MNTRKQVLIMSALLAVMLIVIAIYAAWYPSRSRGAEKYFEEVTIERGSILFARNCRLCHGDLGEGGALGARLPAAPALNRADLQGFVDSRATLSANVNATVTTVPVSNGAAFSTEQIILIDEERMEVVSIDGNNLNVVRAVGHTEAASHASAAPVSLLDPAALADMQRMITNTLICGRVGTGMPPWAQSQGGPLNDEQLRQLMTLITQGRWDFVQHEVDIEDRVSTTILEPLTDTATSLRVSDVSVFTRGEAIRIGDERMRIVSLPTLPRDAAGNLPRDRSGTIQVERGVLQTNPLEHSDEATVYRFPEASEPQILQTSCGQTARPSAPPAPPGLIEPFTGQTVEIIAQNVVFNMREITVNAGGQVRLRLDNRDQGVDHNIAVYQSSTNLQLVDPNALGTLFPGPDVDDTVFDIPAAGSYFFRCDVHPTTMTGTFTVR